MYEMMGLFLTSCRVCSAWLWQGECAAAPRDPEEVSGAGGWEGANATRPRQGPLDLPQVPGRPSQSHDPAPGEVTSHTCISLNNSQGYYCHKENKTVWTRFQLRASYNLREAFHTKRKTKTTIVNGKVKRQLLWCRLLQEAGNFLLRSSFKPGY